MQKKLEHKNLIISILFIFACSIISCSKKVDISGTYQKTSGDYRYNTIVIQTTNNKHNENEYWISAFHEGSIKFKTKSTLKDNTIDMGFIAPIKFYPEYKKFFLELGKGSFFEKQIEEKDKKQ